MIVLWRTHGIDSRDWSAYTRAWFRFAGQAGEAVQTLYVKPATIMTEWDRINITPGRLVAWVRIPFIPKPEFWQELDFYLDDGYRVVYHTVDDHIDPSLVVFQLAGQEELALPRASQTDPWEYLDLMRRQVLRIPTADSRLGEVYPSLGKQWRHQVDSWARWVDLKST